MKPSLASRTALCMEANTTSWSALTFDHFEKTDEMAMEVSSDSLRGCTRFATRRWSEPVE